MISDDNDTTQSNDSFDDLPDGSHLSDEELEAALADFEKEFSNDTAADSSQNEADVASEQNNSVADSAADSSLESGNGPSDDSSVDTADAAAHNESVGDGAEAVLDFDDELQGLLGNKAKMAVVITRLSSAELLAAFCQLADVSATCLDHADGAVGVLRNLNGDGPEAAAKDLTTVVSGMPVILAVNRADKLEATLYLQGQPGQTFPPPILFTSTPPFVEDLMLGIRDVEAIKEQGVNAVDSASLDHQAAMSVIAKHTRFGGRGRSHIS